MTKSSAEATFRNRRPDKFGVERSNRFLLRIKGLSRIYALVRDRADTPINGFGLPNRRIRGGQAPKLLPLTLPRQPD